MLAYSSVAHAGFILTALVAGSSGIPDMWFYVATYSVQVLAAFAVAAVVSGPTEGRAPLSDYAGLSTRSPWLAAVLGLLMLAMGGIPLTAGFVGKVAVFRSAIDADYLWLVIVGVIASVAGLFFYLRVIVLMYMQPVGDEAGHVGVPIGAQTVLSVSVAVTVLAGVVPWPLLDWLRDALPL